MLSLELRMCELAHVDDKLLMKNCECIDGPRWKQEGGGKN